jgi:hypothetical protein
VNQCACGKPIEPGRDECFRCRVSTVGYTWRGGAREGHGSFHRTRTDYLRAVMRVDSEKELAKNPNVSRYDPSVGGDE